MDKNDFKFVLFSFITWRLLLFVFLFLSPFIFTLQESFLGGDFNNYLKAPWLWAWVNFDGEHFLSIAYQGYQPLTYFFFPLYPLLVRLISSGGSYVFLAATGVLFSNVLFFIALLGFWRLIVLDYKKSIAKSAIILLLLFPTSFYFGSFYSESLFFALVVWSFYFVRTGKWILSGSLATLSSATRVVGVVMLPSLVAELWQQKKDDKNLKLTKPLIGLIIVPIGILAYMYYLNSKVGDPIDFYHSVSIYGQQRSANLILIPQVFYRYLFKILPNLNYS